MLLPRHILVLLLCAAAAGCAPSAAPSDPPPPESEGAASPEGDIFIAEVRVQIQPDIDAAFAEAIGPFVGHSRAAEGNLGFELLQIEGENRRFLLLEKWDSQAAFMAYVGSDAFDTFRDQIGPMLAGPPESLYYEATATQLD
ncbi:MAG: hypothetical protein Rubg2KO_26860 [Rubricoccaceae bacterium]